MVGIPVGKGIGASIPRFEDARLLTGAGEYSDDFNRPDQVHAAFLRSHHAHAWLRRIEVSAAASMPGVIAVLTGADYAADGLNDMLAQGNPKDVELSNRDGAPIQYPRIEPLVRTKVRRVGEAIVMIVANLPEQARDATERVNIEYDPLPSMTDQLKALTPDAPLLWDDLESNLCVDDQKGDPAAVSEAFARAAHVVRMDLVNNRVSGVPMEPRSAVAEFNPTTDRYTLWAGGQGVNRFQREISTAFGCPEDRVRVIARDVGGGYGTRNSCYPEFTLVTWAAKRVGRPVKWTGTRSEMALGDYAGRNLFTEAELALDSEGRFLAMRTVNYGNLGTHALSFVPIARGPTVTTGIYDIPSADVTTKAVWTNTSPVTAYRGAGRPEAIFVLERLIERAAVEMGIDRAEIRLRNLIEDEQFPYTNPLGVTYDSGRFVHGMELALELSDWASFEARRSESDAAGKLRGIGTANYVETSTGWPLERAVMEVTPEGRVDMVMGSHSSGQGHETTFRQIGASLLEVPYECVDYRYGDTDFVKDGSGSHAARTMRLAGHLFSITRDEIVENGKCIAAHILECAEGDVEFSEGAFRVSGTDRAMSLFEVAEAANDSSADLPESFKGPLRATTLIDKPMPAYPNGCHVAEVEVDPETGTVTLMRYTAVDDCGRVVNPMIVDGQVHGGIGQGVGQALWEEVVYDDDTGQLISGSFMDYVMPRADDLPMFTVGHNEVPTPTNRMGAKGGGEGGTTPAPAAIVNAVCDALCDYGVEHIQMPVTSEKVWRAMRDSRRRVPGVSQ